MKKIAVASGKGGVGKSMLASGLISCWAKKQKVVAIDADVDAPNLHLWLGGVKNWDREEKIATNEKAVVDQAKCQLCRKCIKICQFGALSIKNSEVVVNRFFCEGCGACEVVCPQKAISLELVKNAYLHTKKINSNLTLVSAQLLPGETGSGKVVDRLFQQAAGFKADVLVVDIAAGTGCPVIAALKEVDQVILVAEPTPSSRADLRRILPIVNHFRLPYYLVINKADLYRRLSRWLKQEYAANLIGEISYDQRIFRAISGLKPIMTTNLPAAGEIRSIWQNLGRK